ncbi:P4HA3 hydroxylase, partial [Nothocercus nigrocapillus]|nr:P4HA3 hydroxylase [Nothocercus nigrocapillus]
RTPRRFYDRVRALHREPPASLDNPLLAFGLIKRLHSDWPNVVYSEGAREHTQELQGGFEALRPELPGPEDLEGAARALLRLQDVYALSVRGLAKGVFEGARGPLYRPAQPVGLSADDCFHVGKVRGWVGLGMGWRWNGLGWGWDGDEGEDGMEMGLGMGWRWVGMGMEMGWDGDGDGIEWDGDGGGMGQNGWQVEEEWDEHWTRLPKELVESPSLEIPKSCPDTALCRSPWLLLQPAKRETLGLRPFVALYHDFVSDAEAEAIKALAGPRLQRSVVASGEQQQKAEYRISKSAWLKDTADPAVAALERRIAAVTGLDVRAPYAEYLQVVNYGLGGHYEPHFDHATSRKSPLYRMNSGNRIATVMIYLSSVEAGGSTAFIHANVSVPVVKNAALFWWNLRRSGEGDGATLHGACPVLAGDKWVANKWIHEHGQEFRRPCGPRPED